MSSSKASRLLGVPCSILLRSETFSLPHIKANCIKLISPFAKTLIPVVNVLLWFVRTSSDLLETFTSTVQRLVQILLMHLITLDTSLSTSNISLNKVL